MHEISIVRDIIQNLEQAHGSRLSEIRRVRLEAGLLSNVQPILIQNSFEAVRLEDPRLKNIDLEIVQLPIVAFCEDCQSEFTVHRHTFVCPCGTPSRKIIQGKELRISQVEF